MNKRFKQISILVLLITLIGGIGVLGALNYIRKSQLPYKNSQGAAHNSVEPLSSSGEYIKNAHMEELKIENLKEFKDADIRKALTDLLGDDIRLFINQARISLKRNNLDNNNAEVFEWKKDADDSITSVITMVDKNNDIWAAIYSNNEIFYYTNSLAIKGIPKTIIKWINQFNYRELIVKKSPAFEYNYVDWLGHYNLDNQVISIEITYFDSKMIKYDILQNDVLMQESTAYFQEGSKSRAFDNKNDITIEKIGDYLNVSGKGNTFLNKKLVKKADNLTNRDFEISNGLKLYTTFNEVINTLKDTEKGEFDIGLLQTNTRDFSSSKDITGYHGLNFVFGLYIDKDKLCQLDINNDKYKTFRGMKVGDSLDDIIEKYGNGLEINNHTVSYNYTKNHRFQTVNFVFNESKKIDQIYLFVP